MHLEADRLAALGDQHHLIGGGDQPRADQLVARLQVHGDQAEGAHDRELVEAGLLDLALARRHHHEVARDELGHADDAGDVLDLLDADQVAQVLTLGGAAHVRQAVRLELVDLAAIGEEEQRIVRLHHQQVRDVVVVVRGDALEPRPPRRCAR